MEIITEVEVEEITDSGVGARQAEGKEADPHRPGGDDTWGKAVG